MISDLSRGLVTAWVDSGLDAAFKAYWAASGNEFYSLHDQQAPAAQPFPYCVFDQQAGTTITRMTRTKDQTAGRREHRSVPLEFRIHARATSDQTSKQLASYLAEEVVKVFGGHPTSVPVEISLTHGAVLQVQYQTDFGTRDGDQEYLWIVRYQLLLDVPVAA